MATLDVSDIPVCPEFSDTFQVMSRPASVDDFGRSVVSQVIAQPLATIYPTGDNRLQREADWQAKRKTLTIVTPYRLKSAAMGFQADLISYRGTTYIIEQVEDYSQYGAGIIVAQASSIIPSPAAPQ